MKKSIYLLVVAFVLTGCSLSMEEFLTPMEERGKDEPYTVECEYGTLTYQFRDSVNYVTDNVQDYIEKVEADTILYFKGDTPKKWLPYVGCKLAASISHVLPYGLNSKVLSVEPVGGLYKVVTTHVSIDDVYESLDYCLDVEQDLLPIDVNDPETYKDKCYEKLNDSTVVYWSDWDEKNIMTRGSDDDYVKDSIMDNSLIDVAISTKSFSGLKSGTELGFGVWKNFYSTLKKVCKEASENNRKSAWAKALDWQIGIGVSYTTHTVSHMERNSIRKYESQYTDSWSDLEIGLEAGMGLDGAAATGQNDTELDVKEIGKLTEGILGERDPVFQELRNNAEQNTSRGRRSLSAQYDEVRMRDLIPESYKKFSLPSVGPVRTPVIMAGPVPICLIFSAGVSPIFEISGSVTGKFKYTTKKTRSGYIVENGEKQNIDNEIIEDGSFNSPEVSINGNVTVGISGRIAIGVEVAGTFGVELGGNLDIKAEAEAGLTWDFCSNEEKTWYEPEFDGNLKFYSDIYGDIKLFVAPLGMSLWDKTWTIASKRIFNFAFKYEPTIDNMTYSYDYKDNVFKCTTSYRYTDLGGITTLLGSDYYAGLRVYKNEYDEKAVEGFYEYLSNDLTDEAILQEIQGGWTQHYFSKLKDYKFEFEIPITDDVERMVLVPVFYKINSKGMRSYIVDSENKRSVELGKPRVEVAYTQQTYGGQCYNFSLFDDGGGYVDINGGEAGGVSIDFNTLSTFKFIAVADVVAGSRLRKWGLKVHVYDTNGNRLLRKKVPFNKLKTGRYTAVFEMVSNCQPVNSTNECLYYTITPYYTDEYNGDYEGKTTPKQPIKHRTEYDLTPTKDDNKDGIWGSIMPEVDL